MLTNPFSPTGRAGTCVPQGLCTGWLSLLEPPIGSKACDAKISSLTTKRTPVTQMQNSVSQHPHNLLWPLNQELRFPLNTYLSDTSMFTYLVMRSPPLPSSWPGSKVGLLLTVRHAPVGKAHQQRGDPANAENLLRL